MKVVKNTNHLEFVKKLSTINTDFVENHSFTDSLAASAARGYGVELGELGNFRYLRFSYNSFTSLYTPTTLIVNIRDSKGGNLIATKTLDITANGLGIHEVTVDFINQVNTTGIVWAEILFNGRIRMIGGTITNEWVFVDDSQYNRSDDPTNPDLIDVNTGADTYKWRVEVSGGVNVTEVSDATLPLNELPVIKKQPDTVLLSFQNRDYAVGVVELDYNDILYTGVDAVYDILRDIYYNNA